jgi:hypothetical protein
MAIPEVIEQFTGTVAKLGLVDMASFDLVAGPQAGPALPFTSATFNPGEGFTQFDEITGLFVPSAAMEDVKSPSMSVTAAVHADAIPNLLKHAIAPPVSTDQTTNYRHVHTLGDTPAHSFALERQQLDSSVPSRLFWGARTSRLSLSMDSTGALQYTWDSESVRVRDWDATLYTSPLTEYTSQPFDTQLCVMNVGSTAIGYVNSFTLDLDWQLQTGQHGVSNQGYRFALNRMIPTLGGSIEVAFCDAAYALLVDPAKNKTPVTFTLSAVQATNTAEFEIFLQNVRVKMTDESIADSGGLPLGFDFHVSGANCMVVTVKNTVASY